MKVIGVNRTKRDDIPGKEYTDELYSIKDLPDQKINEADYILIGAGAGLSTAAGLEYSGDKFKNSFGDFIDNVSIVSPVLFLPLAYTVKDSVIVSGLVYGLYITPSKLYTNVL